MTKRTGFRIYKSGVWTPRRFVGVVESSIIFIHLRVVMGFGALGVGPLEKEISA